MRNQRLLKALRREPVDCTPIWIMRQAGRYLPEYRAIREREGGFMAMCQNPEIACEITLQPLARFELDAAIIFSDILTIPDAMGLGLRFEAGEGPVFERPLRDAASIEALQVPDMQDLDYVMQTLKLVKQELTGKVPVLGFAGSPWTLATYMVEGGSSKTFSLVKKLLFTEPQLMHRLLQVLADSVAVYLNAQIDAGADAVMIFDTWGGVLTGRDYQTFSLHYMQKIVQQLNSRVQVILFTKNGGQWLELIADTGCDAVGIDWTVDIGQARARVGDKVALQGNMDPALLHASPERIQQEVREILDKVGPAPGHVFNLGHGVTPDVPPEHVAALVEAVQSYGRANTNP